MIVPDWSSVEQARSCVFDRLPIADEIEQDPATVRSAPHTMCVKRMDEVAASRKPNVRWTESDHAAQ